MKIEILRTITIGDVPSASGIIAGKKKIFITGDDSPFLFVYGKKLTYLDKIRLFQPPDITEQKIPKNVKPDLEAMTRVRWNKRDFILILGSGSLPLLRDHGFLISERAPHQVTILSLHQFYNSLRDRLKHLGIDRLNIEGATTFTKQLLLFLRGNVSGRNLMITISWEKLRDHLLRQTKVPGYRIDDFQLPEAEALQSGFSGAELIPGTNDVLVTATIENTSDEIADGKIAGSYIGLLSLRKKNRLTELVSLTDGDTLLPYKVESITLFKSGKKNLEALAVCDQDTEKSLMLYLSIEL